MTHTSLLPHLIGYTLIDDDGSILKQWQVWLAIKKKDLPVVPKQNFEKRGSLALHMKEQSWIGFHFEVLTARKVGWWKFGRLDGHSHLHEWMRFEWPIFRKWKENCNGCETKVHSTFTFTAFLREFSTEKRHCCKFYDLKLHLLFKTLWNFKCQ